MRQFGTVASISTPEAKTSSSGMVAVSIASINLLTGSVFVIHLSPFVELAPA